MLVVALAVPLLNPAPVLAASPPAFMSVATETESGDVQNITIDKPSGTVQNDLLIAIVCTDSNETLSPPASQNWIEIDQGQASGNEATLGVWYKVAGASEPDSYTFTWSGGRHAVGAILRYGCANTSDPIDVSGNSTGDSNKPLAPSVTTTVANCTILRIYGNDSRSFGAYPSGTTGRFNELASNGPGAAAADEIQAVAGSTGTAEFSIKGSDEWRAVTVAIKPTLADYCIDVESDGCCPIQVSYNISAANVSANISAGGNQTFTHIPCCSNVTLKADDSDPCCEFLEWVVDSVGQGANNRTIAVHMGANHTAVATCSGLSYTLTTNANPPEGGTVTGGGSYNCCTNATVNATPADACWYFVNWSGNLTGTNSTETIHMDGDKNVTAKFARYSYNLTTNAVPAEGGTVTGGGSYNCCTNATVNATPAGACWYFVNWTGNLSGTNSTETIHMDGDKNVTANFARYSYNLTTNAVPAGGGNVTGGGSYNCCTNATVNATPADACWHFVNWSGDLSGTNSTETMHIDGDKNVTANFARYQYTLTTNAVPPEGGTVTGGGSYNCCTNATVNATPADACWYFVNWSGNLTGTNSTETIHMDGDKNVTAKFARYSYNLTVSSDGCCPIEVAYNGFAANVSANASANFSIPCCSNVTLTANTSACCAFGNWTGDVPGAPNSTNPITVHMDGDKNVKATCIGLSYNLTTNAVPPEGGTVTGGGSYNCCTNATVNATPAGPCWRFVNWTGNLSGTNSTETIHIDGDKNVTANFARYSYNLTTNAVPAGGGNVTGGGSYNCCTNATVNATPAGPCWRFVNWTGDLSGTNSTETIHMDGDKNVTANFARYSYNLTTNAVPAGGGNVTGGGSYNCCTNATVNATPAGACWYFVNWSGDLSGTNSTETIHMDGDKNVTAKFARYSYNLTVSSDGCCPITVEWDSSSANVSANASGNFSIPCCSNVTLTANTSACCAFGNWTGDVPGAPNSTNPITIHMDGDKNVTATCSGLCAIGDTVFYDNNGDGKQDPSDPGIAGVQLDLYRDDGDGVFNLSGGADVFVASRITDATGTYHFTGLNCSATYWVYVVHSTLPLGLTLTTGGDPWGPITLTQGEVYDLANFGYRPPIPVGGEVYPVDKLAILMPWIASLGGLIAQ